MIFWILLEKLVKNLRDILGWQTSQSSIMYGVLSLLFDLHKRKDTYRYVDTWSKKDVPSVVRHLSRYTNAPNIIWTTIDGQVSELTIALHSHGYKHTEIDINPDGKVKFGFYEDYPDAIAPGMYGLVEGTSIKEEKSISKKAGLHLLLKLLYFRFILWKDLRAALKMGMKALYPHYRIYKPEYVKTHINNTVRRLNQILWNKKYDAKLKLSMWYDWRIKAPIKKMIANVFYVFVVWPYTNQCKLDKESVKSIKESVQSLVRFRFYPIAFHKPLPKTILMFGPARYLESTGMQLKRKRNPYLYVLYATEPYLENKRVKGILLKISKEGSYISVVEYTYSKWISRSSKAITARKKISKLCNPILRLYLRIVSKNQNERLSLDQIIEIL